MSDLPIFLSPEAAYVEIFGSHHLIYLAFCIIFVAFFIKNHKYVKQNSNTIRKIFLGLLAFQQIFLLYGWYATCTPNFITEGLPLHLCRVASVLTIFYLIKQKQILIDILSYFSAFAISSLIYPSQVYNFAHISGLSYMINHLITVLIPIFAFISTGWFPSWRSCKRAIIGYTVFFISILIINPILGSSYFYQIDRPFFHDWPQVLFSLVSYLVGVVGFIAVTYIALLIKSLVENRNIKKAVSKNLVKS